MAKSLPETIKSMEDRGVSIANLPIISLAKLHALDHSELTALHRAASGSGIFYLDLRGDNEGERVLKNLSKIYALAEKYFKLPDEAKANDVRRDIKPSQDLGWKKGRGVQSFEISRDEVALKDNGTLRFPQVFEDQWKEWSEFSSGCDEACLTLLNSLSSEFAAYHRLDQPSDTGLKIVSAPSSPKVSDVGENLHTDGGTITLLFYREWGVHAWIRDSSIWAFTPPLEGCALINAGNSLQRISGQRFHSPEHRVTQPFDGVEDRYYLSYFLRPETSVVDQWNAISPA